MKSKPTLLVIDGFSLAFRAYYALPASMTRSDGLPVNMIYGFVSMLLKAYEQFSPTHLCVAFDLPVATARHNIFPAYKAQRPPAPDDFKIQISPLKDFIKGMGIQIAEVPGYEADDVMGVLSKQAELSDMRCLLVTGDHDAYQLISDDTNVVMTKKGVSNYVLQTPESLFEDYHLKPSQIIDLKALQGDSSDNIPGVPGVGKKTATKLLEEYGTLDEIYAHLENLASASVRSKLENGKESAYLSYQLVTIMRDFDAGVTIEALEFEPNWAAIVGQFKDYEFKNLITRYGDRAGGETLFSEPVKGPDGVYIKLDSLKALSAILDKLKPGFAFDLETTSLTIRDAQIVGIALSVKEKEAYYVPLNRYLVSYDPSVQQLFEVNADDLFQMNPYLELLKPFLEDPSIPKITHNGKYDMGVLRNYDIHVQGVQFDTMLAAFLLNPIDRVGLKHLTLRDFGIEMTDYQSLVGSGKKQVSFDQIDLKQATTYAAADADFTYRLYKLYAPALKKAGLENLFTEIELPLQEILVDIEYTGVRIDATVLNKLETEFSKKLDSLSKRIYDVSGEVFNINSPKQLAVVLFDHLGLPVTKKTKTGRSTDSSVLEKLKDKHEIAPLLLQYRRIEKLLGTYVKTLPQLVNVQSGRIHSSFNQTVAVTGRLSSQNPNLQNIPIRTKEGNRVRNAFIPNTDQEILLSADYSQVELRLIAHLSEDTSMIKAFLNKEDIHSSTAAIVEGIALQDVTKEQRYKAKAVNFGILYGISAFGLSQNIGIPRADAQTIIDAYFETFPKIRLFIDRTIAQAKDDQFVKTEFGRFRPLPDIRSAGRVLPATALQWPLPARATRRFRVTTGWRRRRRRPTDCP